MRDVLTCLKNINFKFGKLYTPTIYGNDVQWRVRFFFFFLISLFLRINVLLIQNDSKERGIFFYHFFFFSFFFFNVCSHCVAWVTPRVSSFISNFFFFFFFSPSAQSVSTPYLYPAFS